MVEEDDLPLLVRSFQLVFDPFELVLVHVGAFQGEELDVLLRRLERVVELPVHVEVLVVALLARVVVAQAGVELHAVVEQRLVGRLELLDEVLRPIRAVDVVAHHHAEGEVVWGGSGGGGEWSRPYQSASRSPISYCSLSPVPLSPMIAKCSESGL